MTHQEKQIAEKIAALNAEMKKLRRESLATKLPNLTIEKAARIKAQADVLGRRKARLWDVLHRRCPHDWEAGSTYHPRDYDSEAFTSFWKKCRVCGRFMSLEAPHDR